MYMEILCFNPLNNTSDFLNIEIKSLNEQVRG